MKFTKQGDKRNLIIISLVVVVIVLAGFLAYPTITGMVAKPFYQKGIQDYDAFITSKIIDDLNRLGYTAIRLPDNQTLYLIPVTEQQLQQISKQQTQQQ